MKIRLLFLAMVVGTISQPVWADRNINAEQIREWVANGKILSFEEIFQLNKLRLTGEILDLEVEKKHERIVYEIEKISHKGEVSEVYIDAVTGQFLEEETKD